MSKIPGLQDQPTAAAGERDASEEWPPGRSSFQLLGMMKVSKDLGVSKNSGFYPQIIPF